MEILLALCDFLPVILCFIAMLKLQKCLYYKMNKYCFALLAAGSIMILVAGCLKAFWKLMYYGAKIDIYQLNYMFFPVQAIGFILASAGIIIMLVEGKIKKSRMPLTGLLLTSTVIPEAGYKTFELTMVCVVLQILGCLGIYAPLAIISKKMKKPAAIALFIGGFILMLMMGFFTTRISRAASEAEYVMWNWVAEGTNTIGQLCLLFGVISLEKAGLKEAEL